MALVLGHGLAISGLAGCTPVVDARPNIVFVLVDDLGWTDLGAYGSDYYETPRIDRMAREGMRFDDAYAAAPVCSPTRASILAGKYPARLGLTEWIPGPRSSKRKLDPPDSNKHLSPETITIAEALSDAGYATGYFGKWHLGGKGQQPTDHGFEVSAGSNHLGRIGSYFYPYGRHIMPVFGLDDGQWGDYLTDHLTDEALQFMEDAGRHPFLLVLSHYAVHAPLEGKPELVEKYRSKRPSGGHRSPVYAAMIQSVDESVGRILDKADALDSSRDTVVLLFSDNGGELEIGEKRIYVTTNRPLRAGKGSSYEGGVRAPLIVRWPGVVAPGQVSDVPVTSVDFYPTLLELAGLTAQPGNELDGLSLLPVLKQQGGLQREAIYWHYPHYTATISPFGSIRAGDWKLIEFYEDMRVELYNLRDDIGEAHDLAMEQVERSDELRSKLHRWRASAGAAMPRPNPNFRAAAGSAAARP